MVIVSWGSTQANQDHCWFQGHYKSNKKGQQEQSPPLEWQYILARELQKHIINDFFLARVIEDGGTILFHLWLPVKDAATFQVSKCEIFVNTISKKFSTKKHGAKFFKNCDNGQDFCFHSMVTLLGVIQFLDHYATGHLSWTIMVLMW